MERILRGLLDSFSNRPLQVRAALRNLARNNSREFYREASKLLVSPTEDSPGSRYLALQMAGDERLWEVVSDPDLLEVPQAVSLLERLSQVERSLDTRLIETTLLAASNGVTMERARRIGRALEVLTVLAGARILPVLSTMVKHGSVHVRSKAALLIGRTNRNASWVRLLQLEADGRIRANAVEALWHCGSVGCAEVFRKAVADRHNRVAGNAVLGLYYMGDPESVSILHQLAAKPEEGYRASAAWAMGETGNPRFLRQLADLAGDEAPVVRRNAIRARARILRLKREAAGEEGLRCFLLAAECAESGERFIRLGIGSLWGETLPATSFAFEEAGQPVVDYTLVRGPERNGAAVGFVLPRGVDEAAPALRKALERKPKPDQWGILRYDHDSSPDVPVVQPAGLTQDRQTIESAIDQAPQRSHCPAEAFQAVRQFCNLLSGQIAAKNIIVVLDRDDPGTPGSAGAELGEEARQLGIRIHGIRLDNAIAGWLERAARVSGGVVEECGADELAEVVARVLSAAGQSYEFTYIFPGPGDGKPFRVEVSSGCGSASATGILSTRIGGKVSAG